MAAASRYWRLYWRYRIATNSYVSIDFKTLEFYDASDVHLSDPVGATPPTITGQYSTAAEGDPVTTALTDGDTATAVYDTSVSQQQTGLSRYFDYDFGFGNAVLPEYFKLRVSIPGSHSLDTTGYTVYLDRFEFFLYSSDDGVTYYNQNQYYEQVLDNDTDIILSVEPGGAITASLTTSDYKTGTGGIFGIVSEDGVALPNRPVHILDPITMGRVAYRTTDSNGGYGVEGLNTGKEYLVLSTDPSGPPYKNAIVYDRITPISALAAQPANDDFFAYRQRKASWGGMFNIKEFLATEASAYDFVRYGKISNTLSDAALNGTFSYASITNNILHRFSFAAHPLAAGNNISWLRSDAVEDPGNIIGGSGIVGFVGEGLFTGQYTSNQFENSNALTFEMAFLCPLASEPELVIIYSGTRDSDDIGVNWYDHYQGYTNMGRCLGVRASSTTISVHANLGAANNFATTRASFTPVPGNEYHVVVTFEQDNELRLYVNGVLEQTTSLLGTGALFQGSARSTHTPVSNSIATTNGTNWQGTVRRIRHLSVSGNTGWSGTHYEKTSATHSHSWEGWGGAFGFAAFYGEAMSNADAIALYTSYNNPSAVPVPPTFVGYEAEVEADMPKIYMRFDDVSAPPDGPEVLMGEKGLWAKNHGTIAYNQSSILSALPSYGLTASPTKGLISYPAQITRGEFTIEFQLHVDSFAENTYLWSEWYNDTTAGQRNFLLYLSSSGNLVLYVTDNNSLDTTWTLATLSTATDYHIMVTYDAWDNQEVVCYINGVAVNTFSTTLFPRTLLWTEEASNNYPSQSAINNLGLIGSYKTNTSAVDFFDGTAITPTNCLTGRIAGFALYAYALSSTRVTAHYNALIA